MTPMCSSRPTVSSTSVVECPSGSSRFPTPSETYAPESYGKLPDADDAPRKKNIVQTTLKIMTRISHAPPVCEP